jgi:hypothetical protein
MPPIHNAIKYGTDLLRAYSRFIGLGEDEEGTVRLGETLTPILDLWRHPDADILRRAYRCGQMAGVAAVAASIAKVQVFMPSTARAIAIIEHISLGSGTAQLLYLRSSTSIAGWTLSGGLTDFDRRSDRNSSICQIYTLNDATTPGFSMNGNLRPANDHIEFDHPGLVLSPGQGVIGLCNVVNTNLQFSVRIVERPLLNLGEQTART